MKSMAVTAFVAATAGLVVAAPQAGAETAIRTYAVQNGPCHVNQTYELGIAHNSQGYAGNGKLTFTDNGVPIRIVSPDHGDGWVQWTPTTTGRHTLKLSGDDTELGSTLTFLGSSELVSGSSMFRAPDATVETMVVSASDTTTPCLQ
ncbi:hypothetical protein [Nocardia sp. NPDC004123]